MISLVSVCLSPGSVNSSIQAPATNWPTRIVSRIVKGPQKVPEPAQDNDFLKGSIDFSRVPLVFQESIDFLKDSIDLLKDPIAFLKDSIDFLKHSIDFLKDSVDFLKESIDFLKESVDFLKDSNHFFKGQ